MSKDLDLWRFTAERLQHDRSVMLLVVAESSGSSPGRAGYKMAVAEDGELCGSIGGGVMEVSLVEQAKAVMSEPGTVVTGFLVEQIHRKDVPNSSGMICSGKQTVIFKLLGPEDADTVDSIVLAQRDRRPEVLSIAPNEFSLKPDETGPPTFRFEKLAGDEFVYLERLGFKNHLYIIGGGHCALALSELMSKLDFRVSVLDDRPELNTLDKNHFADEVTVIDSYEKIADHVPQGDNTYAVVMTLGYVYDGIVIRQLIGKDLKYFGVLGSKAKMAALMKELRAEGLDEERLSRIHTPIGVPINSRTPEEIAVSIAAEIIALKNDATLSRSLKEHQNR